MCFGVDMWACYTGLGRLQSHFHVVLEITEISKHKQTRHFCISLPDWSIFFFQPIIKLVRSKGSNAAKYGERGECVEFFLLCSILPVLQ